MFIDKDQLLEKTNGGLDIILMYYPQAEPAVSDPRKQFKIRPEKSASASLKKLEDGNYVVTDFGNAEYARPRNGIQICMDEEGLEFREALQFLSVHFGIIEDTQPDSGFQKGYEKIPEDDDAKEGYTWKVKEFTNAELAVLGPGVKAEQCKRHKLFSLESYTYTKRDKKTNKMVSHVFKSTDRYPIFQFIFGKDGTEWGKRLEPKAIEKKERFRYFGERPDDYVMGLSLARIKKDDLNNVSEKDYASMDEMEAKEARKDKKLPEIIICGGDRDALSTEAALKSTVVWFNSETADISKKIMKELTTLAYKVYYLGDIDDTGLKVQHKLGMQHLDLHLIRLPDQLKKRKDHRGNPCKDVRDYLNHYSAYNLKELKNVALPYRMWDEKHTNTGKDYILNPLQMYNFLQANGFYRFQLPNVKTGYIYIHIDKGIVRKTDPVGIKAFVNDYLEDIKANPRLRNKFYSSRTALAEQSLSNLKLIEVDFNDSTKDSQMFFFKNMIWEVTKNGIEEKKPGSVNVNVWEEEVIQRKVKKLEDPFNVFYDEEIGSYDIKINDQSCLFLKYLINTSRVHWHEEKVLKQRGGGELSEEKKREQRLHLINKMYTLGYLLHKYKDPSKTWAVFAMDNKISEFGESNGGTGKSIAFGAIRLFMNSVYLEGRNPKFLDNPHVFHNVTSHTSYLFVDDANKWLDFGFFYPLLTGAMTVNPKFGAPYEIPFDDVPKIAITSNYALRDDSVSTHRRLLFTVFSDYYHVDKDGEYGGSWTPKDEFGKNLFTDFTDDEWNSFLNTMAHCLKVYLTFPNKIDPPMENVNKRNQVTQMTQEFLDWADIYFGEEGNADKWIIRQDAYNDFLEKNPSAKRTFAKPNRFKKSLIVYCKYKGYELNPDALNPDANRRLVRSVGGTSTEHIYVKAFKNHLVDFKGVKIPLAESIDDISDDDIPF